MNWLKKQYATIHKFIWWLFIETEIERAIYWERIDNYRMNRKKK